MLISSSGDVSVLVCNSSDVSL